MWHSKCRECDVALPKSLQLYGICRDCSSKALMESGMLKNIKQNAPSEKELIASYKPPFTHSHGYIFDADGNMVADESSGSDGAHFLRIRGWGKISYFKCPEEFQDAIANRIAKILTKHWGDVLE